MKILLVDVDSKIPNLALMKLSTWHKSLGHKIDIVRLNISYYPNRRKKKIVDALNYEKVFVSAIFFESPNFVTILGANHIQYGGTGYSITDSLPEYIENCDPDYSLYPDNKNSYGFLTRGCIRNCPFCVVPEKEGMVRQVSTVDDICKHDKVYFLDNNILAFKDHKNILQELVNKKIHCQFNQGLDIRLLNDENAGLLSTIKYLGDYIFAFDDRKFEKIITRKLRLFRKYFKRYWGIKFFIYCDSTQKISDLIYRLDWCRDNNVLPYLMRNINCWSSPFVDFYTDLAAYCNQPSIWKKMTPEEYITKRQPNNLDRQKTFNALWKLEV
jgi:hypothetical protein